METRSVDSLIELNFQTFLDLLMLVSQESGYTCRAKHDNKEVSPNYKERHSRWNGNFLRPSSDIYTEFARTLSPKSQQRKTIDEIFQRPTDVNFVNENATQGKRRIFIIYQFQSTTSVYMNLLKLD
jgi:hypothetical protein